MLVHGFQKRLNMAAVAYDFLKPAVTSHAYPYDMQLEVTNVCNLTCIMCPRDRVKSVGHMKLENFRKLMDEVGSYLRFMTMSGYGEPFLNSSMVDMITYAKKYGIFVKTFSNFTVTDNKLSNRIIETGLDFINCSVDAGDPQSYKEVRGGDLKRVVENVANFVRIRNEMGRRKPFVQMNAVVFSHTLDEFENLVRLAAQTGVDMLTFKTVGTFGLNESKEFLISDHDRLKTNVENGIKLAKELNVKTSLEEFLPGFEVIKAKGSFYHSGIPCYAAWHTCFVSWYGGIRPCCDYYDAFVEFGNAFEEGFRNVWNGEKYKVFRRKMMDGMAPHPLCMQCNLYPVNIELDETVQKWRSRVPLLKAFSPRKPLPILSLKPKAQKIEVIKEN